MDSTWRTISQVNNNKIFDNVKIGDEVAIMQHADDYWWVGKVVGFDTYAGRGTRFQERPVLDVDCIEPIKRRRIFYEEAVSEILFKD